MSDFKTIETQEELDRIIGERLARQREKFADYDELKARLGTLESVESRVKELETENGSLKSALELSKQDKEKSGKRIEELEGQVAGFESQNLRTRIALQHGLPFDLADRLVGGNEEELKADAERLAGFMKPSEPVIPLKDIEPATGDHAMKQMLQELVNKGE